MDRGKRRINDAGAKAPGRVSGSAGEIDSDKLDDEEDEADADRSQECGAVFFGGQHEDRENELGGEEYLDEHALSDCGAAAEVGTYIERYREEAIREGCSSDSAENLGREEND